MLEDTNSLNPYSIKLMINLVPTDYVPNFEETFIPSVSLPVGVFTIKKDYSQDFEMSYIWKKHEKQVGPFHSCPSDLPLLSIPLFETE